MNDFLCIGHRGASGYEPENTLRSFERAINMGCQWIELDVYCVQDELLVIHDDSLERTTNGEGARSRVGGRFGIGLHFARGGHRPES